MSKKNLKQMYDTCRLFVNQIDADVAAGRKPDPAVVDSLKSVYEEIIECEKFYLIQGQDKLFGTILMEMDIGIDFTQRGKVDLKIDCKPMKLTINPCFCADYSFPEFTGFIINEMVKMIYLHPAFFASQNSEKDENKHELLEEASSAASTDVLKHDIRVSDNNGVRLSNDLYTSATLKNDCSVNTKSDMDINYYYNILNKFKKKKKNNNGDDGSQQPQMSQLQAPDGGGNGQDPGDPNGIATKNNNNGKPIHDWEKGDEEELKEEITSMVSNAYNSLNENARGLIPAGILAQIKALLEPPEIDWKQVLRKMVGSVPVPYRKSRARLNRRQPFRADLCGHLPKRTVNIVCAFDTSGSMSDNDIAYCMNEVFNIIKVYEGFKVTIIECDAEIGKIYEAKKIQDVSTKVTGRGGTSFVPVIEYINGEGKYEHNQKYPNAGKYRDALLIYFTDGYGDSSIPKPKTYRNLWVVMQDAKNLSLEEPYGDVKSLSGDKDWKKMRGQGGV